MDASARVGARIAPMRIALLQFAPAFGAVEPNLDTIREACAGLRADLLVLPELCTTGYQFRDRGELAGLAQPADGPATRVLAQVAGACGGHVVAGLAESTGDRIYNSAVLVGPGGLAGLYRKVHLFDEETRLFDPGDRGFPVFDASGVKVGMMVCFDWLFPEAARSLALAGAQIIAHPANLVLPHCQRAMVTRAVENRVFTATCNRVGREERVAGRPLVFTGGSRVVDPGGSILADGPVADQELLTVEIDPGEALDKRITTRNHVLADRRGGQYRLAGQGGATSRRKERGGR